MIERLSALLGSAQPIFFLLAGPNGAGKSTFRKKYLDPAGLRCIDPDEIARSSLGRAPKERAEAIAASAEAMDIVRANFQCRASVALETVFSDAQGLKLSLLSEARSLGYRVGVIFIGIDDPQLSIARVMDRVETGGHDVPDELIMRRFPRSYQNLRESIPLSDFILLVDNSRETRHRLFASITQEGGLLVWDRTPRWYYEFAIDR